jgi:hypothetical protein
MQDQARRLSEPLRWGRQQKLALAVLVACLTLGLGALGVFALTSGAPARADCVDFTFPSTLGAGEVKACGAHARKLCFSGAYRGIEHEMKLDCEKAGFPFRSPPS